MTEVPYFLDLSASVEGVDRGTMGNPPRCACEVAATRDNWHHEAHVRELPDSCAKSVSSGRGLFLDFASSGRVLLPVLFALRNKLDLDLIGMVQSPSVRKVRASNLVVVMTLTR